MPDSIKALSKTARACTLCASVLPDGLRPVFQIDRRARILIAGQAPGAKVHKSGVPFDDASGDRLREWMGVDADTFYDPARVAILPMAFCYPGKGRSGDLPPPVVCPDTWRQRFLDGMPSISLTLVIGQYAQQWHLPHSKQNLTETVRAWASCAEHLMPLPHPSPRNN